MGLTAWADKKVTALSKGMAQKVQFIATVVARPELVLLDEPFSGLDPVNADVLREAVARPAPRRRRPSSSRPTTWPWPRRCATSIFMIYRGKKVLDGTLEAIQDAYGEDTLRVRLDGDGASLDDLPGVVEVADFGRYQELRLDRDADPQAVLAALMDRGEVRLFELSRPSLHDIFVRIAGPSAAEVHGA